MKDVSELPFINRLINYYIKLCSLPAYNKGLFLKHLLYNNIIHLLQTAHWQKKEIILVYSTFQKLKEDHALAFGT